jgi:divalent metal cation (Fe/Co/Zn/Cd) transporter
MKRNDNPLRSAERGVKSTLLGDGIQFLCLHIVVQGEITVREGHLLSHKVEDEVRRAMPQVAEVLVHVEPEEELTTKTDPKRTLS